MRRFALLFIVMVLGLTAACGGDDATDSDAGSDGGTSTNASSGDSNGSDDSGDDDSGGGSSASTPEPTGGSSGGGSDDDFCRPDNVDAVFDNLDFTANLGNLEEQFSGLRAALGRWADNAPGEIEDDVRVLVAGTRGMIDLFEEYNYDFLAIGTSAIDDPRFTALEDPEFQAASDRVASFCGFDADPPSIGSIPGPGTSPGGGGSPGGDGGFTSGALPDGFPEALEPPNSEIGFAGNIAGAVTAEFSSTSTIEEIREFYEGQLGEPTLVDQESMIWSILDGSSFTNVTVTGTDGDLVIVVAIVGT